MNKYLGARLVSRLKGLLLAALWLGAFAVQAEPGAALREKYAALKQPLQHNAFNQPLVLSSAETPNGMKGDIYAVVAYPFGVVNAGLNDPTHWCDVMILHINTKYCHAMKGSTGTNLRVYIGKKTPELLAHVARLELTYSTTAATPDYFEINLRAEEGPLGTSNYRISIDAVSLPNGTTFLQLTYSYDYNLVGRLAAQAYLSTLGRGKVGFTQIGQRADGRPDYIGGVRGVVERNTMRYYLAIHSFLEFVHTAPVEQLEKRLQSWFTAVERYPRQLHELDRADYLEMKRAEYLRQQTLY